MMGAVPVRILSKDETELLDVFGRKNYCDGSVDYSLDVSFTSNCDSACSFCIAAPDMSVTREFNLQAMLDSLSKTDATVMSILGGEPLLYMDKLILFIERAKEEYPQFIEFHVTTALPYSVSRKRESFDKLMSHLTSLNVSVNSVNNDVNNAILQSRRKFDRLSVLRSVLESHSDKIRIHLNLTRSGINSKERLDESLATLRDMGVQKVKLNELMGAPDEYVSFEEMTSHTLDSPYYHGCSTGIQYFDGLEIVLKRSCFVVEGSRPMSALDALKLDAKEDYPGLKMDENVPRVLYSDGSVSNSWLNGEV